MRVVKLTPKAEDDLEAIWHYGRQHFGEAQADKFISLCGRVPMGISPSGSERVHPRPDFQPLSVPDLFNDFC